MTTLDKTQFLPDKELNVKTGEMVPVPRVNAFRAKQGNVRYEGQAIKALTWMPDIMLDREWINGDHMHTCGIFYRAVVATRKALGIGDLRAYLAESRPDGAGAACDVFFAVLSQLPKAQSNMCLWVVCDEYNRGNFMLAYNLRGTIQAALENAQIIIDREKEKAENTPVLTPELSSGRPHA